jgi:thiamine biosynthesis lipoprotein
VDDRPPDPDVLAAVVASIREPRFEVVDGRPVAIGDCSMVEVNAIAKGYIVDRALAAARALGPALDISVNAGGDLAHRGQQDLRVGIEDPIRPYDNEPPLTSVHIRDEGLATSGRSRRGVRIGGRWYGHVIDPATGMPVEEIASITVVAADAVRADVLATVAGVRPPRDAAATIEELGGHAGLVVDHEGRRWPSPSWPSIEASAGPPT